MTIDVSIVTYNSSKWLDKFFESLLSQDYPAKSLNIYVRDNSSTDDTVLKLKHIERESGQYFSQFMISEGPNAGFGAGHNSNFKKGNAPLFLVTNVDLIFEKKSILEIVSVAEKAPDTIASFEFRQKPYEHPKYYDPATLETRWSSSACVLFRRAAFVKIGGYEERIFLYGEDVEVSYRLRDNGYTLQYCPKAVCWHFSYAYEYEIKKNMVSREVLANAYIRLRYGTLVEIVWSYMRLVFKSPKKLGTLLKNTFYFLRTRKKSNIKFIFYKGNYDYHRAGAFYACAPLPIENLPLVSVITRTCPGRAAFLTQSMATVLNQTYPAVELIVVEDGGNSAEVLVNEIKQKNVLKNIIYHSLPKSGRSIAGNKGLELASGEYVFFFDDDDLLFADHIEVLALKLKESPECGAAYALAGEFTDNDPLPVEVFHQAFSRELLLTNNYLPIQTVLFRRLLYLEKGGFDPALDAYEDWDLWIRYTSNSRFLLVEKVTSLYRVPSSLRKIYERKKIFSETRSTVLLKNHLPVEAMPRVCSYGAFCIGYYVRKMLRYPYRVVRKIYRLFKCQ